ncbi:hypothetical protein Hanom_Chr16g01463641 [Helianthus anomalus]
MTNLPFPLKGQTTGTLRASSSFLCIKSPPPHFIFNLHPPSPSSTLHYHRLPPVSAAQNHCLKTATD